MRFAAVTGAVVVLLAITAVMALIDAVRRPASQFSASDRRKSVWVTLNTVGVLVPLLGPVLSIYYLAKVRPQLSDAREAALT